MVALIMTTPDLHPTCTCPPDRSGISLTGYGSGAGRPGEITCTCGHLLYILPPGKSLDWTHSADNAVSPEQAAVMRAHQVHRQTVHPFPIEVPPRDQHT